MRTVAHFGVAAVPSVAYSIALAAKRLPNLGDKVKKYGNMLTKSAGLAVVIATCAVALASCASESAPAAADVIDQKAKNIPAVDPKKQRLLKSPVVRVKPGEDRMICWVPSWVPDKDYYVAKSLVMQGSMGHHLVTMKSDELLTPGKVFDCGDITNMLSLRPLILPDNSTKKQLDVMPAGHAVKLPKGTAIVMQSHYINVASKDMEFQDAAILDLSDQPPATEVSYLIVNDSHVNIAPGQTWSHTSKCNVPYDMNILATLGHMHEWGTNIEVKIVPPTTDPAKPPTPALLYEVTNWEAEFRDTGPITQFKDPAKPMFVKAGSSVEVTCTWKNTKTTPLKFPHEMCVSVSYYYPATGKGLILCDP